MIPKQTLDMKFLDEQIVEVYEFIGIYAGRIKNNIDINLLQEQKV